MEVLHNFFKDRNPGACGIPVPVRLDIDVEHNIFQYGYRGPIYGAHFCPEYQYQGFFEWHIRDEVLKIKCILKRKA